MPARSDIANAIRALSMDAVQQANSGHPGAPMGMADFAEVLWNDFLRHDPNHSDWPNRDRFVLSNGHASMLLYSLLHLTGYPLTIDDIKQFRQFGSLTPGHPEAGHTPGVETTTGPLGQGLANAVGMALAERLLATHFNRPEVELINHRTYVCVGDGCLMEGLSHEAASLAGTLGLGKLVVLYDMNGISIDGDIHDWFTDDTPARFAAYGWQVIRAVDGHDPDEIRISLESALAQEDRPTLICYRTIIGRGSPAKQGTHDCHGAPLGAKEVQAVRQALNWPHGPFEIPTEIYAACDARQAGGEAYAQWQDRFAAYRVAFPELAAEFERRMSGDLPENFAPAFDAGLRALVARNETVATRVASKQTLDIVGPLLPELLGGSADLTPSNNTFWAGSKAISATDFSGNYVRYGVREFAMAAMMNGMALHGGFIPYAGTFLVFSDYARNAMRLSALMKQRVIYVLTHDSIGLGEDGPTHQPVEHTASLRLIPNMAVWRPCDAVETAIAWRTALERRDGPTALILSRQNLPAQNRSDEMLQSIERGGYVLYATPGSTVPEIILIATGSEVALAMAAARRIEATGRQVRVVSMPCPERFIAQPAEWCESVLPKAVTRRIAIEAGSTAPWYRFVGLAGRVIGMDSFGESAPAGTLFEHFGFTVDNVVNIAASLFD